jgi:alkaline phosphatase D
VALVALVVRSGQGSTAAGREPVEANATMAVRCSPGRPAIAGRTVPSRPVDAVPTLSRRSFLAGSAAAAATLVTACSSDDEGDDAGDVDRAGATTPAAGGPTTEAPPPTPETTTPTVPTTTLRPAPALGGPVFTLGVASGDPDDESVVLWTRLAVAPLDGGGMPDAEIDVAWEVARDDSFDEIVASGTVIAAPADAHSVHVVADLLDPATRYSYRFRVEAEDGEQVSPIGRTRTFPAADDSTASLVFAFASCQDYQSGAYAAWRDAAATPDLDCVVFLGDYIYEDGAGESAEGQPTGTARLHLGGETFTLADYRNRYALYRGDPDLAEAHRVAPWIVTWDDHEAFNNYAGATITDPAVHERRAAAYKAWWEHQPVRIPAPTTDRLAVHRTVAFGDLATFFVLDGRQYRTAQPCVATSISDFGPSCDERLAETASVLGPAQEDWLVDALAGSSSIWDVIANDVILSGFDYDPRSDNALYLLDTWDGYPAARDRLIAALARNVSPSHNTVVITGDVHASFVMDTLGPDGRPLATELVGTSVTSRFPLGPLARLALPANPHTHWFDDRQGYVRCRIGRDSWTAEYRVLADEALADRTAALTTVATAVIVAGTPGATVTVA